MNTPTQPPGREPDPDTMPPAVPGDSHDEEPVAGPVPAAPEPAPKKIKASPATLALMAVVALAGVALILWGWKLGPFNTPVVSTDNAYVRGQITVLAPQVNGYVAKVLVQDYQHVQAGQPLVEIDNRTYQSRAAQAQAQLENAIAQLRNAEQTEAQNLATVGAARAGLAAVEAEQARSKAELGRVEELAEKGSVSLNERDRVRSTSKLAGANVLKARAEIDIANQRVKGVQVARSGLEAQVKVAQAQLALAQIDLANTVVRAPRAGQVGEASVRLGQYVTAGSQLMFLVPDSVWVIANFKENQTNRMRIGQRATFKVDAFDGATLTGKVQEIAPATGSEFSVLRPDNASGNFTKVVQRLPVRIAIDANQELAKRLRPGMSVVAHVDTRASEEPAR